MNTQTTLIVGLVVLAVAGISAYTILQTTEIVQTEQTKRHRSSVRWQWVGSVVSWIKSVSRWL